MKPLLRDILKLVIKIGVIAGIIWLLLHFVFGLFRMDGNSMFPNVKDGDLAITYRLDPININDVVVYKKKDGSVHFGRVVGRGGDTISVENGQIVLNGEYLSTDILYDTKAADGSPVDYPYTVSDDAVFVVNDYRSDTSDSREFGEIKNDQLQGKLVFILRRRNF